MAMGEKLDLTGQRFGRLLLLNTFYFEKNRMYWECLCDCGNIKIASENSMKSGHTKSCGCLTKTYLRKHIDLTGRNFGKLTVIKFSHKNHSRQSYWLCKCDCGNERIVSTGNLRSGHIQSCGCLRRKDLVGHRFEKLLVLTPFYIENGVVYWECLCDCGNIKILSTGNLENTQSCGCVNIIDLINQKFGRLTVVEFSCIKNNSAHWLCRCDCGEEKVIDGGNLRNGNTQSCGCFNREISSKQISGEKHPFWRGGSSKLKYPKEWTRSLRSEIRNRDQHKCQYRECTYDDTKEKRKLDVHHIDGNKQNCEPYNLISLCGKHHTKIEHNNPENWIDYFYQITGDFYGS